MILFPTYFGTLAFSTANGFSPKKIDISSAKAQSKIKRVAGGALFDFNYGQKAALIPEPFSVEMILVSTTTTGVEIAYEKLAHPTTGIVGTRKLLKATDRRGNTWQIEALCDSVAKILTEDDNITKNVLMDGVEIFFVPIDNWEIAT